MLICEGEALSIIVSAIVAIGIPICYGVCTMGTKKNKISDSTYSTVTMSRTPVAPSLVDTWKKDLQISRQDGVYDYIDRTKPMPHLPVEILWQIMCGRVDIYDPATGKPLVADSEEELAATIPDVKSRMAAAIKLIEYSYGRPAQEINIRSTNVNASFDYSKLPTEKLIEIEKHFKEATALLPSTNGEEDK